MLDETWDLIDGNVAHEIEILNYANQVNVIEALVRFILYHAGVVATACPLFPDEMALKEMHRTGTLFLLSKPGEYREVPVAVKKQNGDIVYVPPPAAEVPDHMATFFQQLAQRWQTANAAEIAAYALWMLNWVHPFKNGNGRTARAFSYACLCLKFGFVLPGFPTVIDQIMNERDEYQDALKAADQSFKETGTPDLGPMTAFIGRLLLTQLQSIPES